MQHANQREGKRRTVDALRDAGIQFPQIEVPVAEEVPRGLQRNESGQRQENQQTAGDPCSDAAAPDRTLQGRDKRA